MCRNAVSNHFISSPLCLRSGRLGLRATRRRWQMFDTVGGEGADTLVVLKNIRRDVDSGIVD